MHREEGLSFACVETFNLDEYYPMPKDSIHSYHRFMWENLFSHVDIDPARVHIPPGDVPREQVAEAARAYEAAIARGRRHRLPDPRHRQDGTHRLQRAGLRRRQPHAPRHARRRSRARTPPPTSSARSTCRARRSRWASRRFSTRARSPSSPRASTRRRSSSAPSRATSTSKSPRRSCSGTRTRRSTSTAPPAAELTRIKTPWLLDEVQWTQDLMVRAVIWLSQRTGQGDPQAHPARLRRRAHVVARREVRLAGRGERQGLQPARRQDPRKIEAADRPADRVLLAAPGRRRDLDGRHPAQARRERQRDRRRLHDERQHRRVRSRRPPVRRLPRATRRRGADRSRQSGRARRRRARRPWSERRRARSTRPTCRSSSASFAKPKR